MSSSVNSALYEMLHDIDRYGYPSNARGMPNSELTCYTTRISDPRNRLCTLPGRPIKQHYAAASVMWNLARREDVEGICFFNDAGRRISDDGEIFHGADYGSRILRYRGTTSRSPLTEAIDLLKYDRDTRRAWVPIHNWWTDGHNYAKIGKDVPCTIGFGLRVFDEELTMQVVMRSQSAIGVFPYDVFLFTTLQELIANELELGLGDYEHFCMSTHVYDREQKQLGEIIDTPEHTKDVSIPMRPLGITLTEAKAKYTAMFDSLLELEIPDDDDPLLELIAPFIVEARNPVTVNQ